MTYPALLNFLVFTVLFLDDKVRIDLLCCSKAFGLQHFEVDGNTCPIVVKKLERRIFVDKWNFFQSIENISTQNGFSLRDFDASHPVDKFFFQECRESGKGGVKSILKSDHIRVALDGTLNIRGRHIHIRNATLGKQRLFQRRERRPEFAHLVNFCCRDTAKHRRIDIPMLGSFRGINIARNVQVIIIAANFFTTDDS